MSRTVNDVAGGRLDSPSLVSGKQPALVQQNLQQNSDDKVTLRKIRMNASLIREESSRRAREPFAPRSRNLRRRDERRPSPDQP